MSFGHGSGPANDVVDIVGVQARQAAHGQFDPLCTCAGPLAALLASSADNRSSALDRADHIGEPT
jgi:hypothetical protein